MNSKVLPVLYISNGLPQIAFCFQNNFECLCYLAGHNDEKCFDDVLSVNDEKLVIPLKSFFYKESSKFIRSRYLKLAFDEVIHLKKLCPRTVEKKKFKQINICSYNGTLCFVFHTTSTYIVAMGNFLFQHGQVSFYLV